MSNLQNEMQAYNLLCVSYHAVDDFRAKLLGFLPVITGAGMGFLLEKLQITQGLPPATQNGLAAAGVFGFLITCGLFAYEIYGIKKCAALITAGKQMEDALHMDNGQFKSRPQNVAKVINEPFAAAVIYPTVLAAWAYFACAFAWPAANPLLPIVVLLSGFVGMLLYEFRLRTRQPKSLC